LFETVSQQRKKWKGKTKKASNHKNVSKKVKITFSLLSLKSAKQA